MTQVLRGRIEPLGLVDVLAYLGRTKATGALNVELDDVKKSVIISEGMIVFARSNQTQDRLGDILLGRGMINQEQYDQGTALIYEKGFRHGRALVEIGAISPKQLWETIQEQVRNIAGSIIPWTDGNFEFINKELKRKEAITLKWDILDLVQDVIRNLDDARRFRSRFPDMSAVFRVDETAPVLLELEPHEDYVLRLIDGEAPLTEICAGSDYGEAETLRMIYLLKAMGRLEELPDAGMNDTIPGDIHPMITGFNQAFAFVHQYLSERVGPVGTNLLQKMYGDMQGDHAAIFAGVTIMSDGKLHPGRLQKNLTGMGDDDMAAEMALDEAMNEFLNVGMLAVKKLLGAEHESEVVTKIGELLEA